MSIYVERFSGETEKERVRAGGKVAKCVVNQVCGFTSDCVADSAEVVGQCPRYAGGGGIGEEFVLSVWRPEVMVRAGWTGSIGEVGIVELNGRLVAFGNEYGLGICGSIAIEIQCLADPNIIIIVSVFNDLDGFPSL